MRFLELEGGYIFIAIFIMAVTIFVTTRSFMSKKELQSGSTYGIYHSHNYDRGTLLAHNFKNGKGSKSLL
jgi:hypothetical protein